MRTPVFLILCSLPAAAAAATFDWQVYQRGNALELAVDRNSVQRQADGLIRFINQERFAEPQFDRGYKVRFSIRRTTVYADCKQGRYALVSSDFYSASNKSVWSTMYPVPRYAWKWQDADDESVAAAMMAAVCPNP
ncbi:surface-adhesin E family protein [Paludibacterium yongneupense]|uniref:surface-adhesin E family protein n=1 Tax=Paludibacterium yongneupense TaxID=400061 RepID=UPI00048F6423|nr:surface-adhesin E family protein [Paludibacterium yongneupense]